MEGRKCRKNESQDAIRASRHLAFKRAENKRDESHFAFSLASSLFLGARSKFPLRFSGGRAAAEKLECFEKARARFEIRALKR